MARVVTTPGMVLGVGMGGFVDGIVFHQILQLHNMLSARIPPDTLAGAKANMIFDGIFHAFVWLITAAGIAMLWRAGAEGGRRWSGRAFAGALLLGWGLFNVVEGVIDHYLLGLHHVVEAAGLSVWDHLFIAWGAAMVAVGWVLARGRRAPA